MFGARRIFQFRPMVAAIAVPLMIGLTVQALGPQSPAGAAGEVDQAAFAAKETIAKRAAKATISLAAAPVGQTPKGKAGLTPGVATFRPARPGRPVLIQGLYGSRWKVVARAKQDRRGQVGFNVAAVRAGKPIQFRAVANRYKKDRPVKSASAQSAAWALSWSDEFTGSGPLGARWRDRQVGERFGRRLCSEVRAGNARRQGGNAVLEVRRLGGPTKKCKDGQYSNAMVMADRPEDQIRYGFAAARVKFQSNRGQHSAFWLQVPDNAPPVAGTPPAAGAEIDVAEYFGDGRKDGGLASYIHWVKNGKDYTEGGMLKSRPLLPRGKEWSDAWHVYSVEWTPKRYIFRVDGNIVLNTTRGISNRPEAIVLSALTSDWETKWMDARKFPTVTKYDWVRVWKQPTP